jgi:hypothetical protein
MHLNREANAASQTINRATSATSRVGKLLKGQSGDCPFFLSGTTPARLRNTGTGNGGRMASPKRAPKRKLIRLNQEAFKQIDQNASIIASALCESTEKGNVISARLLVELAQDQMETEEVSMKQQVQTIAQRLAKEKEWQGPPLTPEEEALATGVPFL